MKKFVPTLAVLGAMIPAGVAYAALLGLGFERSAPAWAASMAAAFLVFAPPLTVAGVASRHRGLAFASTLGMWAIGVLVALPVYFPGERREAVHVGLALLTGGGSGEGLAQRVADAMPEEPSVAEPPVPEAVAVAEPVVPDPVPLKEGQIALPYEGDGRNLSVPVVFEANGRVAEDDQMMLDTGATYTTLPTSVLSELGIEVTEASPEITLHTANGKRTARIVLVDRVWLGDLLLEGVAVTTCDDCASGDAIGLLGLNVAGAYNTTIDADRREVVFTRREAYNHALDVKPFVDLGMSFVRLPGGRVEVTTRVSNTADRRIDDLSAGIQCGEEEWVIDIGPVAAEGQSTVRNRLPRHAPCETYMVTGVKDADW